VYAITGITGKVGGIVARTLLAAGLPVRAVVRDADKGRPWADKGCEIAIASIADADGRQKRRGSAPRPALLGALLPRRLANFEPSSRLR
jgi:nucleoside-diphosphate-sugar epimerase